MGRLFWKIFFGFWFTLLVIGSISGALVWQHNKERIEQLEVLVDSPRADMGVSTTARILRYGGIAALKDVIEERDQRHHRPFRIFIVNDQGQDILGRPVSEIMLRKAREALNKPQQSAIQEVTTPEGQHFLLFIPRLNHLTMRRHHLFPDHMPKLPLLILFLGSLMFSAGLAWYITRPIRYLREATNHFAEGKMDTRVMPNMGRRRDEITDLANDFDHMAEQVQQLIAAQKRLLNDVSHELRSPLARLQVAIEMGRQQPEKQVELMQRIEKESQRLDELVGNLLTLSRLEAGIHSGSDYFDINGLVESVTSDANFEAKGQNKQVVFSHAGEVLVKGSMELMRRAIENVVRNAIFYTPEASQVVVSLTRQDRQVVINVCDNGKGVSEAKLAQLFQPFVRISEDEQNIKIPGYGLGLAIAQRAVEIHHGSITAYNQSEGGLCIKICLPV